MASLSVCSVTMALSLSDLSLSLLSWRARIAERLLGPSVACSLLPTIKRHSDLADTINLVVHIVQLLHDLVERRNRLAEYWPLLRSIVLTALDTYPHRMGLLVELVHDIIDGVATAVLGLRVDRIEPEEVLLKTVRDFTPDG